MFCHEGSIVYITARKLRVVNVNNDTYAKASELARRRCRKRVSPHAEEDLRQVGERYAGGLDPF